MVVFFSVAHTLRNVFEHVMLLKQALIEAAFFKESSFKCSNTCRPFINTSQSVPVYFHSKWREEQTDGFLYSNMRLFDLATQIDCISSL